MQKFLIVGLGNIGEEYKYTRHNIGFLIADRLVASQNEGYGPSNFGLIAKVKYKGKQLFVLKPNTYMNLSGKAVKFWLQKENIPIENLFVATDDLNLQFKSIRIRAKGTDGGHNGLKSIQQELNTPNYNRLRFGIGSEFSKGGQVDFVLGKWSEEEVLALPQRLDITTEIILSFCLSGLDNTMNAYNGK